MTRWTGEAPPGLPYWWEDRPDIDIELAPPGRVDVLVVGAGYTGLSAAIAAHDCGADVAVLDAGRPGDGASTRNGGMMGAHPRLGWDALEKSFGAETANALFAEAAPALDWVRALIRSEHIDCDLQHCGRIQLAWTEADFQAQRNLADLVRAKSAVRIDVLARDALADEIVTEQYFGAVRFPEHGSVHPRKFHDGLLRSCLRRGVQVVGDADVTSIERTGGVFVAHTPLGAVQADKIILATNGYTSCAFQWFQRRVFPLPSFLIATEELPEGMISHLAPGGRMMVETRATHSYFRASPDGKRILYGGRAAMRPIALADAARRLQTTMADIWPELADVRLSHVWTGYTGYSFSHMPTVGEQDGLHFAMGFSGSGTVMAPYLGAKAAYRALGDPRGETGYADTALRTSWLHPGTKPWFLYAADFWYRHKVDRLDARRARTH